MEYSHFPKEMCFCLAPANYYFDASYFPGCWKSSSVVTGEPSDLSNYDPIKFPIFYGNVFETLINEEVVKHLPFTPV